MSKFTLEEWRKKAAELYGDDPLKWRFKCPVCEYVACVQDWKDAGAPQNSAGFSCVGRWAGVNEEKANGDFGPNGIVGKGPCNYAGGGLFKLNPVTVIDPDGQMVSTIKYDAAFKPLHGHRGHTHAGTVRVDYEYQVEMWVDEIQVDYPHIMRIECPDLGREWKRIDGRFVEQNK